MGILSEENTMKTALTRELEITLETALMLSPETPVSILAGKIYDSEPALVAQIQREWIVERLVWMLRRKRQRIKNQDQLILPGFQVLPRRLSMIDGTRLQLRSARLLELLEYRKLLVQRRDARIETLDKLIELVKAYAKEKKDQRITVATVFALEAAKMQDGGGE